MAWDDSKPDDTEKVTTGQAGIIANWTSLNTTIAVDHNAMDQTRDGEHKQLTLYKLDSKPSSEAKTDTGFLYSRDDGTGTVELFYEDSSARDAQLTSKGNVKGDIFAAFNFDNTAGAGLGTGPGGAYIPADAALRSSYNIAKIAKTATTLTVTFTDVLPANYLPLVTQNDATVLTYSSTPTASIVLTFSTGFAYCMGVFYDV